MLISYSREASVQLKKTLDIKMRTYPVKQTQVKGKNLLITGAEAAALPQVGQVFLCLLHVRVDLIQTLLYSLQLLYERRTRRRERMVGG